MHDKCDNDIYTRTFSSLLDLFICLSERLVDTTHTISTSAEDHIILSNLRSFRPPILKTVSANDVFLSFALGKNQTQCIASSKKVRKHVQIDFDFAIWIHLCVILYNPTEHYAVALLSMIRQSILQKAMYLWDIQHNILYLTTVCCAPICNL